MSRIPQVNLNDYLSGNSKSKEKFIKDLGKGFSEIGFVAVKGHLLNDEAVSYTHLTLPTTSTV